MGRPAEAGDVEGLRFRVTDLRRHPGSRIDEVRTVMLGDLRIGDAEVDQGPVAVTVGLESLSDGVRTNGSAEFGWSASCRRCLDRAEGIAAAEFRELFVDDPEQYVAEANEEVHAIGDGWVDLGDVVRDAVLLGLPLAPLCGDDCVGPSPEAFPVEIGGDTPSGDETAAAAGSEGGPDPRWAALSELRFDPPED